MARGRQEVNAWTSTDLSLARDVLRIEKEFIEKHLLQWIPIFCDKVINKTESDFYRAMAQLTKEFVRFDLDRVSEAMRLVDSS